MTRNAGTMGAAALAACVRRMMRDAGMMSAVPLAACARRERHAG